MGAGLERAVSSSSNLIEGGSLERLFSEPTIYFVGKDPNDFSISYETTTQFGDRNYRVEHITLDKAIDRGKSIRWSRSNPILVLPYNEIPTKRAVKMLMEVYDGSTPIFVIGEDFSLIVLGKNALDSLPYKLDELPSVNYLRQGLKGHSITWSDILPADNNYKRPHIYS